MESIASLLVFTILIASVTMMILFSLRITGVSIETTRERQDKANAVLAADESSSGIVSQTGAVTFTEGIEIDITINITATDGETGNRDGFTAFKPEAGDGGT